VPSILTIIDTQYFQNPEHFSFLRKNYLKFMMEKSLNNADGVITISESVKAEMKACFELNGHSVKVIRFGLDPCFKIANDKSAIELIKQQYGIKGKYLLFPGYPHYRKNIPRLIKAFAKALKLLTDSYTLVIAGEMGAEESDLVDIKDMIEQFGLGNDVLFTGYVPGICLGGQSIPNMALLINGAELLVYPSLYEGFGLPVLEAMACATPVLTSKLPVMHEVAGNAAIFIDPYQVDDIAQGIYIGLTDESLRRDLIQQGLARSKQFSWIKNAETTLEYYKEVFSKTDKKQNR
jgi:glycosyltransferase involved in cell wall biosynthesis